MVTGYADNFTASNLHGSAKMELGDVVLIYGAILKSPVAFHLGKEPYMMTVAVTAEFEDSSYLSYGAILLVHQASSCVGVCTPVKYLAMNLKKSSGLLGLLTT